MPRPRTKPLTKADRLKLIRKVHRRMQARLAAERRLADEDEGRSSTNPTDYMLGSVAGVSDVDVNVMDIESC